MKAFERRMRVLQITLCILVLALVVAAIANVAQAMLFLGGIPTPTLKQLDTIPTPGTKDFPSAILKATLTPALTISGMDPAFWRMLTPEGQEVLSAVTLFVSNGPRYYQCPQVWEVGSPRPTPAICTYYGGVYEGATNTITLWGEAAQANPDILRHEALHALDAADGQAASETAFQKLASGDLAVTAEAMYTAGGGTWFRPGELYAMVPLVVDWHFDQLPPGVASYYAAWFVAAEAASLDALLP